MNLLSVSYENLILFVGDQIQYFLVLILIHWATGTSYNQPNIPNGATWSRVGEIIADHKQIGNDPFNIFIDGNNKIYVAARGDDRVFIKGNTETTWTPIKEHLHQPTSIFTTIDGDIYIGQYKQYASIRRYSKEGRTIDVEWASKSICRSVFIDPKQSIYCSVDSHHVVLKKKLNNKYAVPIPVAGFWTRGLWSLLLDNPKGIFVAKNFSLYVADFGNDRIQMFQPESRYGITVAGKGARDTVDLRSPIDVALDGNGDLFIVDMDNRRIVASSPNGFRCIIGCRSRKGRKDYILNQPKALSFDTDGNIYVVDTGNRLIQKFFLKNPPISKPVANISCNQPVLCPTASWKPDGVTVMNETSIGILPWDLFIDHNNTLYVNAKGKDGIQVLYEGNDSSTFINNTLTDTISIFVTDNGDIYVNGNDSNSPEIQKWANNGENRSTEMYVSGKCFDIFVDIYGSIYCSLNTKHQVIRRFLNETSNITRVIAGYKNGTPGNSNDSLKRPRSIFVTTDLDMYVADCGNDRVQLFEANQKEGKTVLGNTTIGLHCPTGLALDGDGYLFVSDHYNQRVIGSGPNGFRCIIGCTGQNGSQANELSHPRSIAFDNHGNIYVVDGLNNRIQKFDLTERCDSESSVSYNTPKLHQCSQWNANGITVTGTDVILQETWNLLVKTNDTFYVHTNSSDYIFLWQIIKNTSFSNLVRNWTLPTSMFVNQNGDVYFYSFEGNTSVIHRWMRNTSNHTRIINVTGQCYGLFVDLHDNLYCSMKVQHRVVRKSVLSFSEPLTTVAGNGTAGSSPTTLNEPMGIFVTIDFHLYVADCSNDRIQLFLPDDDHGITIVGNGSDIATIDLSCPTSVTLDGGGYLFISDSGNYRIIGEGPDGYRCIVGCSKKGGSASDQLNYPTSIAFDRVGNLYVTDYNNSRIQQFLINETCTVPNKIFDSFMAPSCLGTLLVGPDCNISSAACDVLEPCLNNGICSGTDEVEIGFHCQCPDSFNGRRCEIENNLCHTNPCQNGGTCNQTSPTAFECKCTSHWTDNLCQTKVDFCRNVTCFNNGQCRPLVGHYRCECLSDLYSGRHCEIVSGSIVTRKTVAKSFAYVAIIAMGLVATFIIVMDVLKYGFGIDPVGPAKKKRKRTMASSLKRVKRREKF